MIILNSKYIWIVRNSIVIEEKKLKIKYIYHPLIFKFLCSCWINQIFKKQKTKNKKTKKVKKVYKNKIIS